MENNNNEPEKAPFNMAQDTLKRLGKILEEIKALSYRDDLTMEVRQAIKIGLLKQFFIQSSPLLPEEEVKNYKLETLKLKSKVVKTVQHQSWDASIVTGQQIIYDEELEFRLDEILIEIQMILQKLYLNCLMKSQS
jgi:hypothetical protein